MRFAEFLLGESVVCSRMNTVLVSNHAKVLQTTTKHALAQY